MSKSPQVFDFALKPDTRHWEKVPAAIYITRSDSELNISNISQNEKCWQSLPESMHSIAVELGRFHVDGGEGPGPKVIQ